MGPVIAISGTPGTGKTAVAQLLAVALKVQFIELTRLIEDQQLFLGKDPERGALIADIDKIQQYLIHHYQDLKDRIIVVGHFADEVPDVLLDILVVLRCNPIILIQRLRKRNWPEEKIVENVQAEILGECTAQGLSRHAPNKIFEIDTSNSSIEETTQIIQKIIKGHGSGFATGNISWLRSLDPHLLYQIMEKNMLPSEP